MAHLGVSDARLRDREIVRLVLSELLRPASDDDFGESLHRAAASAATDLALAGQLDQASAFGALRALAGIGRHASSAGTDDWQWDRADADLARTAFLLGGAVDGLTVAAVLDAIENARLSGADAEALNMLIAVAPFAPAALLKQRKRLYSINIESGGFDSGIRRSMHVQVIAALARADLATQKNRALPALVDHCMDLIKTRQDAEVWQSGMFCAYFLGLGDPNAMPLLRSDWSASCRLPALVGFRRRWRSKRSRPLSGSTRQFRIGRACHGCGRCSNGSERRRNAHPDCRQDRSHGTGGAITLATGAADISKAGETG